MGNSSCLRYSTGLNNQMWRNWRKRKELNLCLIFRRRGLLRSLRKQQRKWMRQFAWIRWLEISLGFCIIICRRTVYWFAMEVCSGLWMESMASRWGYFSIITCKTRWANKKIEGFMLYRWWNSLAAE